MSTPPDPYIQFREDVQTGLNNAAALFDLWQELQQSSSPDGDEEFQMAKVNLSKVLDTLTEGAETLDTTIRLAESKPAARKRFNIDDQELATRKAFVADVRAKVANIERVVNNPALQVRMNRRDALMQSSSGKPMQARGLSTREKAMQKDNDAFAEDQHQAQAQIVREQDMALDDIHAGVTRVKEIALVINDELHQQGELIVEIDHKADNFSAKLARVQTKLDEMLKNKDSGKICSIFLLMIVLVVVAAFAIYV